MQVPAAHAIPYLAAGAVVFLELATPSFINEYDSRPNGLFVEYLIYPKEVAGTLLAGYGFQLLGAAVAVMLAVELLRRALRSSLRLPRRPMHVVAALVLTPVLFVLCVAAMRSSFDHRAANPSMAALSRDPMVNDLGLNSLYSLLYAVSELQSEPQDGFRYSSMADAEALSRVQAEMRIAPRDFVPGAIPTLHRQIATGAPARPKNLVIVLEESLGAEFVGALGGLPLTPNLDSLSRQGWWF